MTKTFAILFVVATLNGCGGPVPASNDSAPEAAATAATGAAECSNHPDFVVAYADAKFIGCFRGGSPIPHHESGTIIYTTAASALTIQGWYKGQAIVSGMHDGLRSENMYSARDGTKRTFMVLTAPAASGTKVTLNWGRDL
ncbi:hypothetical protein BH09PSE4_BH09PSE4_01910 [soil metagenome]